MTSEVEWRRRWKPTVESQPWRSLGSASDRPIKNQQDTMLVKFANSNDRYNFMLYIDGKIYEEEMENDQIKKRTKKLNPGVEAPTEKILDHIRQNLENQSFSKYHFVRDDEYRDQICLTITTKLAGLPFVWKFKAISAGNTKVSDHVVCPLVTMVNELLRQRQELYGIVGGKDKEIEDLRAQGGRVSRKHLETARFDETAFLNTMVTSKGFAEVAEMMSRPGFPSEAQTMYTDLMQKHAWLNRDPEQAYEGESLEDEVAMETTGTRGTAGASWASNRLPPSLAKVSPTKSSPSKSPVKAATTPDTSPSKETEQNRRQALEKRLADEDDKKVQKSKKKKVPTATLR